VVFDTTNHRYHLARASDTTTPLTHPTSLQPYRITFGQGQAYALAGVQITSVSVGGDNQLKFGAYGQIDQSANATITVACDGETVTVTVDAVTGETTIQ
jgi:spore coat protein U-like protein